MKKLYRYTENRHNEFYEDSTELKLLEIEVIKETEKGFWVKRFTWNETDLRFVLKGSTGKRYAFEEKKDALANFIYRKKKQIAWNKMYIEQANHSLNLARSTVL